MTNPNNEPTPISKWIKRAASAAEFIEQTIPPKDPPVIAPPTEEKPTGILHALMHISFIIVCITLIFTGLRFSLHNIREQVTHTTIIPEQYHYTSTPPITATSFTQIQQCTQQQQSCYISNDMFQNASNISLDGYLRHQHKNNNNGLWISNGHNGHPEIVYILFPNDPTPYMISQEFFPGKDIAIYAHDHDIPLYHVDGNNGQNSPTDGEKAAGVIGGILFHAIL